MREMVSLRHPRQVRALGLAGYRWGTADGDGSRRPDLPWRSTRDPWAVLVSEVMAQQTSLDRVVPAYLAFLERFPTVEACAAASMGEVLRAWKGLGYNRRARDLHRASAVVVTEHGGRVPSDLVPLLALPGVGPYTARAVLAFAFGADVGVVDTNAGRVLSRAVAGRPLGLGEAQHLADTMVPSGRGWEFGQALLDLGATVCVARAPVCGQCPVRRRCRWAVGREAGPDPAQGSAAVSVAQTRFEGSDRQGRGRLVDALRSSAVRADRLSEAAGWPDQPERAARIAAGLVTDGLAVWGPAGTLRLP